MKTQCPLAHHTVNDVRTRIVAFFVAAILIAGIVTHSIIALLYLLVDFSIRGVLQRMSPLCFIAMLFQKSFKLGRQVNAGPKVFGARMGMFGASMISLFAYFELWMPFTVASGVLASLALLSALVDYCMACLVYPYWRMLMVRVRGYCVCVRGTC